MHTKQHILIAGCGDLGIATAAHLQHNYHVHGLRRSTQALPGFIHGVSGDVTDLSSLSSLQQLSPSILVYCASAGGQNDESYHAVYVQGLKNVLQSISHTHLTHVFFVSSTRVYNGNQDEWIDESVEAIPNDFGGERLLEAEQVLNGLACTHTVLRLSGIYGPGRTRMINLALNPYTWPQTNNWSNRIHRDDAASFIAFLIEKLAHKQTPEALYIVTDGVPTQQYEVLMWIAKQLHIEVSTPTPQVHGGKKLLNHGLASSGFILQYADYIAGYGAMLKAIE